MKKTILILGLSAIFLQACSYHAVIDTSGRSGTFNESRAENLTNDMLLCDKLAKENSNMFNNIGHWILSPEMDTRYRHIYKTCLNNRGHSILY